jgi:hypothetical protein
MSRDLLFGWGKETQMGVIIQENERGRDKMSDFQRKGT